jgi:hypothetical protein
LKLVLFVSSSAPDTDFAVKLVDVFPDGTALNVRQTIRRTRFREGRDHAKLMRPGEIVRLEIDLNSTSLFIPAGHRIQVLVTSSDFPNWDRNLNTGGNNFDETQWRVAINTVHESTQHASYLVLPVAAESGLTF